MGWRYWHTVGRITAGSAFFAIGAIAGLLPGPRTQGVLPPSRSPAEIVAARFDSLPVASRPVPAPSRYLLASAAADGPHASGLVIFPADPVPEASRPAEARAPQGDALKAEPEAGRKTTAAPAAADELRRAAPVLHPSTVLNNGQIASIHERLKLSSYQNQLWPPVESALRDISWRKDAKGKIAKGSRSAAIDPDSAPVQRLKSAAVPLIMSFNEDQKQEVRSMLRLMGLENLATRF